MRLKNKIQLNEDDLLALCNIYLVNFMGYSTESLELIRKILIQNDFCESKTFSFVEYLSNFHSGLHQRWISLLGRSPDSIIRSESRDKILAKVKEQQNEIISKIHSLYDE